MCYDKGEYIDPSDDWMVIVLIYALGASVADMDNIVYDKLSTRLLDKDHRIEILNAYDRG